MEKEEAEGEEKVGELEWVREDNMRWENGNKGR